MKILFITSNRVGDAVLSTGLLAWMEKQYPTARFTIACGPYAADLFRATPRLDKIIVLKKKSWNRHWLGLWRQAILTRWDLIVDLRDSAVSRLVRAERRAYRVRNHDNMQHKVVKNGLTLNLSPPPAPHIWLDAKAEAAAEKLLPPLQPFLALGPAANWPVKQWPIERFAELAQKLTSERGPLPGAPIMIIGDEKERAQIMPLINALPKNQAVDIIGQDLMTVAACLKHATLFVGNDSGLMHLSAAVGTKTLGLFGPGYEEMYAPWGPHCAFVRTPESRKELLKRLKHPGAHHPNLMESLTVDTVVNAAERLLG
ncbi:MAG TPA: glycosyltransferase family 9 protein [Alphaproteobacteria bacterium]|nr:glycosyltransferase family 9 protein [Alphaproteobacteria bacterium]